MKNIFKKIICTVLTAAIMLTLFAVPAYASEETAYIKSTIIDKANSTILVSCKFPQGAENRIATVILAKEEIAEGEAIDLNNGKIENIMMAPIDYNGDMDLTVGYSTDEKNYILYVVCGDIRLEKIIDLDEHITSFNLSDEYGALKSDTMKGRLEERLTELPEEVSVASSVTADNQLEIYVSDKDGLDSNAGSEEFPLKTIGAALTKLVEAETSGTIVLRGGTYNISNAISINASHTNGATNDSITMIKGYPGEEVYFESNPHILPSRFESLDAETAKRIIDETASGKVLQVELPADYNYSKPSELKLYINGNEMMQSRWPNNSEVRMGTVTSDKADGWTTKYLTLYKDRLDLWNFKGQKIYFNGCFNDAEYAPAVTLVRDYNTNTGEITTGSSWSGNANPTAENATHFYCNVLEEIDVPGEWCVDNNNMLYIYPTEDFKNSEIVLSAESNNPLDYMIKISNAKRLVFDNINFRYAKNAVFATGCSDVVFQNCSFNSITDRAVVLEKCKYSGVINSEFADIGKIGVEFTYSDTIDAFDATLSDEDFYNMIPSRNFVQKCVINGIKGADNTAAIVDRYGIGNIFSYNVIGNVDNNGFLFTSCMEDIVEYNEIFSFAQDISDSGAIYLGSLRTRGNMVRYNYIHDPLKGGVGVYFDNMSAGNYAYGNVIKNCLNAYSTNGGRDNAFGGNIIINENEKFDKNVFAVYSNPWQYHPSGTTYFDDNIVPQAEKLMSSNLYTSPVIKARYTEWMTQLEQIQDYLDAKEAQGGNYIVNNASDKTDKKNIAKSISGNYMGNNLVVGADNHMEELLTEVNVDKNGVNHGFYCWMWDGIAGFCDTNGNTAGVNTNIHYTDGSQTGFKNYTNDDFELNLTSDVFVKNKEFKNIPFAKIGMTDQKANMPELEFFGTNYSRVDGDNDICNISWGKVNGAEEYIITIAEDDSFENIVKTDTVRNEMYVYEGDLYARPYYIRIEYTTSSKLYKSKTNTAYKLFETCIPKIEVIDKTEQSGKILFNLRNNVGEKIVADIYVAQYEGDILKKVEKLMGETMEKDASKPMSVTPEEEYSVKLFLWNSNMKPYTDAIILK